MSTTIQGSADPQDVTHEIVRHHFNALASFQELPQPFTLRDGRINDAMDAELRKLSRQGLLIVVGEERVRAPEATGNKTRTIQKYRINPKAQREFEELREQTDTLPCGHRGFQNLGDVYTCSYDHCDETHSRATVAEVFG